MYSLFKPACKSGAEHLTPTSRIASRIYRLRRFQSAQHRLHLLAMRVISVVRLTSIHGEDINLIFLTYFKFMTQNI